MATVTKSLFTVLGEAGNPYREALFLVPSPGPVKVPCDCGKPDNYVSRQGRCEGCFALDSILSYFMSLDVADWWFNGSYFYKEL